MTFDSSAPATGSWEFRGVRPKRCSTSITTTDTAVRRYPPIWSWCSRMAGSCAAKEYDGSEWWEYEPPFRVPETQKPFKLVKLTSYRTRLLVEINYPMEATEE